MTKTNDNNKQNKTDKKPVDKTTPLQNIIISFDSFADDLDHKKFRVNKSRAHDIATTICNDSGQWYKAKGSDKANLIPQGYQVFKKAQNCQPSNTNPKDYKGNIPASIRCTLKGAQALKDKYKLDDKAIFKGVWSKPAQYDRTGKAKPTVNSAISLGALADKNALVKDVHAILMGNLK